MPILQNPYYDPTITYIPLTDSGISLHNGREFWCECIHVLFGLHKVASLIYTSNELTFLQGNIKG